MLVPSLRRRSKLDVCGSNGGTASSAGSRASSFFASHGPRLQALSERLSRDRGRSRSPSSSASSSWGGVVVLVDAPLLRTAWHTLITSSHIVLSTFDSRLSRLYVRPRPHQGSRDGAPAFAVPFFALVGPAVARRRCCPIQRWPAYAPISRRARECGSLVESFQILVHLGHRILAVAVFVFAAAVLIKKPSALTALTFGIVAAQACMGRLSALTSLFLPVVFLSTSPPGSFSCGWTAYHAAPALFFPPLIARSASA